MMVTKTFPSPLDDTRLPRLDIIAPELHELGPFDEAKRLLDEAAAQSLVPTRIVLILETEEDLFTIHTGEPVKPSVIAGLCFMAAQTVCE